jgi:hypothetical protein
MNLRFEISFVSTINLGPLNPSGTNPLLFKSEQNRYQVVNHGLGLLDDLLRRTGQRDFRFEVAGSFPDLNFASGFLSKIVDSHAGTADQLSDVFRRDLRRHHC